MLIYHPAYDAFHCVVRVCAILEKARRLEIDRLRILDFYLCFPGSIANLRLPKDLTKLRGRSRAVENPYRNPIGEKRVFDDVEKILDPSLSCLKAAGIVSIDEVNNVERTSAPLLDKLAQSSQRLRGEESFFFDECLQPLLAMELLGTGGLKDRSGLLEYRYDAA